MRNDFYQLNADEMLHELKTKDFYEKNNYLTHEHIEAQLKRVKALIEASRVLRNRATPSATTALKGKQ